MPATAGRVRMPANNRVHSSAALQTHGIWQSAIGYDPYAPSDNDNKAAVQSGRENNAYDSFQGLLALARLTTSNATETRGDCKKCGRVGHLTFQCRNFLSLKDDLELHPEPEMEKKEKGMDKNMMGIDKCRVGQKEGSSSSEEEDDSTDVSDSSEDSEMERIIAKRFGEKYRKLGCRDKVKKSRVSDCGENEYWRKSRVSRVLNGKCLKSRVSSDEETGNSDYDSERDERRRKSRVSKKNGISRVSEDSEHEDRERRKRVKSRRISKRVYSGGDSLDSEGERSRRRKRRDYADGSCYYSSDEERKRKRSKRRRVEYSDYSEDERRKRNGSCSTGSNSDSEDEMRGKY